MELRLRFNRIQTLLEEILPLISAQDHDALYGNFLKHPWLEMAMQLTENQKIRFDAYREYQLLDDPNWTKTIDELQELCTFPSLKITDQSIVSLGKKKKVHEFNRLFHLLKNDQKKHVFDFGGGVGNLAHFLEKNLAMTVTVIEKDQKLIHLGKKKMHRNNGHIHFEHCELHANVNVIPIMQNIDLSIGLHTCGNFANNMLRTSIHNKAKKIVNFGCCYSKIQNDDYHLNKLSHKNLTLNGRALSIATLGFGTVTKELYDFRLKIMFYKFSLYHWLAHTQKDFQFIPMSNARKNAFHLSFSDFAPLYLAKFYPQVRLPHKEDLERFYTSKENQKMMEYFRAYYAIARYFGELLENYILCDRALYLQEHGYDSDILSVFDANISPRNKAIVAHLNNSSSPLV